jgi:hypothetical protein
MGQHAVNGELVTVNEKPFRIKLFAEEPIADFK